MFADLLRLALLGTSASATRPRKRDGPWPHTRSKRKSAKLRWANGPLCHEGAAFAAPSAIRKTALRARALLHGQRHIVEHERRLQRRVLGAGELDHDGLPDVRGETVRVHGVARVLVEVRVRRQASPARCRTCSAPAPSACRTRSSSSFRRCRRAGSTAASPRSCRPGSRPAASRCRCARGRSRSSTHPTNPHAAARTCCCWRRRTTASTARSPCRSRSRCCRAAASNRRRRSTP